MRKLPDKCVDLVVTSPPYNLKNSTGNGMKDGRGGKWSNAALIKGYATYDDNMPYDEYCKWQMLYTWQIPRSHIYTKILYLSQMILMCQLK